MTPVRPERRPRAERLKLVECPAKSVDVVRLCEREGSVVRASQLRPQLGCPHVLAGQLQRVQRHYSANRYEVIWTCGQSLRSYRYPQPAAVPNQAWRASYETAGKDGGDDVPCVSVPLPGGRFLLQLRGGKDFARQLADFRQIVNGTAAQG